MGIALKFLERNRLKPALTLIAVVLVALAGVTSAAYNDRLYKAQAVREISAQAQILAASVNAALTFDDANAAQEYVDALKANPGLEAAGVYTADGVLLASFSRPGVGLPKSLTRAGTAYRDGRLTTIQPVVRGSASLGHVYLRAIAEPVERRLSRYIAIGLLAVMAMLVVAVLGSAQGALRRANNELARRNAELGVHIEEREKAEEALRQSQKMEAIGQITGGVAHDFNNILMVASSGLDLLDRTDDAARRARLTDGIRQAVKRGADLTRQLLAFARRTALKPEVVDLAVHAEGTRTLLDRSLREDISVVLDIQPGAWPVEVDPGQLELALLNVGVNARDAMPHGGVITIGVENTPDLAEGALKGDFVRISVTDQGEGMSPETLARAFEPFFTTKEVGKGTGLGLSQVYGFSRASGGDVHISSVKGLGTTVSLYLPRSTKTPEKPDVSALAKAPTRGDGRILLVEDDDGVAGLVGDMLHELGYECRRAAEATEALEYLEKDPDFDLVFSDMVMPGEMNGIELAREIARRRPELPLLLTTGFSPAAQAAAHEGLRLLSKPYTIDALAQALSDVRSAGGGGRLGTH